ncbi:MAG TPA: DUF402 domain-containing protein [Aggregatilineales bacterium]|nr:DUF402 domain-containing protein [Aggregatilineales bacterium]
MPFIEGQTVKADDLEVDVFVAPDGTITLLDEQEFEALPISAKERMVVFTAIQAIRQRVTSRDVPFDKIR